MLLLLEGGGGGSEPGAKDATSPRNHRNHRIDELRREVEKLRARIADAQDEQRRAVLELNELLEEKRHLAQRARQQERVARVRRDVPPDASDEGDAGDEAER